MNLRYIRNNIISISILLFIVIYGGILFFKPGFLYNNDGSLRQFGLNSSRKTIIPAWLLALIIAISSYFLVLYYLTLPKFRY
jgi:uncharacterized PurR-regulated membrane protein YhhQ (DUF165 family)